MNATQYRQAIARLGLSQVGAAQFLEVDPRTSRRWAAGDQPIPKAVELLFDLMLKHRIMVACNVKSKTPKS